MQKQEILNRIKSVVKEVDASATVMLYGSRARGDERPDSDWDILILVDQPAVTFKDGQKFRHKLYELELQIGEPISTFIYSSTDWKNRFFRTPFYNNVTREGVML